MEWHRGIMPIYSPFNCALEILLLTYLLTYLLEEKEQKERGRQEED